MVEKNVNNDLFFKNLALWVCFFALHVRDCITSCGKLYAYGKHGGVLFVCIFLHVCCFNIVRVFFFPYMGDWRWHVSFFLCFKKLPSFGHGFTKFGDDFCLWVSYSFFCLFVCVWDGKWVYTQLLGLFFPWLQNIWTLCLCVCVTLH